MPIIITKKKSSAPKAMSLINIQRACSIWVEYYKSLKLTEVVNDDCSRFIRFDQYHGGRLS